MGSRTTPINLARWLARARSALAGRTTTPYLEAQALAAHVLGKTKEWVIAHSDVIITPEENEKLSQALKDLAFGVPLAYLTGEKEFYGLQFRVTPDVLVPRPETELLVENAINWLNKNPEAHLALEIGTGSGCIAISLAKHSPNLQLIATDRYWPPLKIAQENVLFHNLQHRITLLQANLLRGISGKFDLLVTNPPYIPTKALASLEVARSEPLSALDGGEDGLFFIREIIRSAPRILKPGGVILMEIEQTLGGPVQDLAKQFFPKSNADLILDYSGFPRILRVRT
ncbi:MAG: peptide chain release factor N(5)-glutamine methyltransferase [Anaerolineae bacterium]|nr:peptide chain release factor N(5)-glutamine methyltransferase [Anaerolineae bacterium]